MVSFDLDRAPSGLLAGCEAIVTNDERWKRRLEPAFRTFRWVYLADHC